jgi:hypothetical protein
LACDAAGAHWFAWGVWNLFEVQDHAVMRYFFGVHAMALLEDRSASFIVRVWCESGAGLEVQAWRGSVEHVGSGDRVFFSELDAMLCFMRPHLRALGIEAPGTAFWERVPRSYF